MFNILFLITAILFVIVDSIYLNLSKNYFTKQIMQIQGTPLKVKLLGAAICYIFLIFGLNYFIIKPKKSVYEAFIFGLIIYGVYETTNYALFSKWSILTVFMDTIWGGILCAIVTFIANKIRTFI